MLKLKLQYFGHLIRRTNPLEKTLMLGKIEGRRRRGWQRMRWLEDITDSMNMSLSQPCELVKDGETWFAAVHDITKSQTWLSNSTKTRLAVFQAPIRNSVSVLILFYFNRWLALFFYYCLKVPTTIYKAEVRFLGRKNKWDQFLRMLAEQVVASTSEDWYRK